MKETILHTQKDTTFVKEIIRHLPSAIARRLPGEITIVPVPEKESASLNRAYRGKNKPANVLSFRYGKEYGEIIVCPAVIRREAQEQKRAFQYQMTWMILHGMIHLSGLHHEASAAAAKRVERLEQSILGILFTDSKSKN